MGYRLIKVKGKGVHIVPENDEIEHELNWECICGPDVEIINPKTEETYVGGPVVIHYALDGRDSEVT